MHDKEKKKCSRMARVQLECMFVLGFVDGIDFMAIFFLLFQFLRVRFFVNFAHSEWPAHTRTIYYAVERRKKKL